jgi:hypothetical protein
VEKREREKQIMEFPLVNIKENYTLTAYHSERMMRKIKLNGNGAE